MDTIVNFWKDIGCVNVVCHHTKQDGGENDITGTFDPYPNKYGKGEWVAKSMEDAKRMVLDFRKGVS